MKTTKSDTIRQQLGPIVVVDDEYIHAERAFYALQKAGFAVVSFHCHLDDAEEAVVSKRPSILLLDVGFEGDNNAGFVFLRKVRNLAERNGFEPPYAVFLSGLLGDSRTREQAEDILGATVLSKPLKDLELIGAFDALSTPLTIWTRLCTEERARALSEEHWVATWNESLNAQRMALIDRKYDHPSGLSREEHQLLRLLQERQERWLDIRSRIDETRVDDALEELRRLGNDADTD